MASSISIEKIDASLIGIGSLIKSSRFTIPIYQRPYSWTDDQIDDLYRDLNDAIGSSAPDYFLGTLVTSRNPDEGRLTIIDGQQRLVTVSVLIAAIRDYFQTGGQQERAQDIEREYLFKRDIRTQELTPHIYLTADDREFFVETVAKGPPSAPAIRAAQPSSPAQQRLHRATEIAATFVNNLLSTTQKGDDRLLDLIDFLTEKAKLVSVSVGSESSAFVIFEVLNDRGLDLSIIDLLKNYVFRTAANRVEEAQAAWTQTTIISEVASEPELKNFVRHYWTATHGMTRERELYDAIKKVVSTKAKAVEFAKALAKASTFYAGLSNPASDQWDDYQPVVRQSIEVLDQLGVSQLRPLVLAIFQHFSGDEIAKALPAIVAWSVRFLICGSGGSGTLETAYAERARDVSGSKIKSAAALWEAMKGIVPDDITFKSKFATATVSKADLAKYYLRVLEQQSKSPDDEMIVNPDQGKVNLEHILPRNPAEGWAHIPAAQITALIKRLGNLTLLATRLNSKAANAAFDEKKKHFTKSAIAMTKNLCVLAAWTPKEIAERQETMADLAVKAWPGRKPK